MPRKGRSNEEVVHALHQVEGGEIAGHVKLPSCSSFACRRFVGQHHAVGDGPAWLSLVAACASTRTSK